MKHGLKGSGRMQRWGERELGLKQIERGSKPGMMPRRKKERYCIAYPAEEGSAQRICLESLRIVKSSLRLRSRYIHISVLMERKDESNKWGR